MEISEIYIIIGVILGALSIIGIAVNFNGRLTRIESEIYIKNLPPVRERLTQAETKLQESEKSIEKLEVSHNKLKEEYYLLKTLMEGINIGLFQSRKKG
ncbi:MAG: hypothetical protein BWK75_05320 [Candidatus Altiarchaeales archaeon A3]|nr:MAG: hypothetical protein BWK75_05320 [Candidatus Altiarchaeales archaeon A3]